MNKNIKLLVENLFYDSDNDLFVDQEQEYNDIVLNNIMYKSKEEVYDYIVKKYKLYSINDCKNIETCPDILDLTDIARLIPENFDTSRLFKNFLCKEINISNWKIRELGEAIFYQCRILKNIIIPNAVKIINNNAFIFCESLETVTMSEGLINIGENVFYECEKLTNINIPNSIRYIGNSAFNFCIHLLNINIPNNITNLNKQVFANCFKLTNIIISDSVRTIDSGAFQNCTYLNTVFIPNSVKNIDINAFVFCDKLKTIKTPKGNKDNLKTLLPENLHQYIIEI